MTPRSNELYEAVRIYVSFAEKWLKDQVSVQPKLFFLNDRDDLIGIVNGELRNSPQYRECLNAVLQNEVVASQLDLGVGIVGQSWMMLTPWHLMRSLLYIARFQGPFEFSPRTFDEEFEEFENSFYEERIRCEAIGPVEGVAISANIELSESLEIGRMTDDEKQAGSRFGIISTDASRVYDHPSVVRARYTLPKFVGSVDEYNALDSTYIKQSLKAVAAEDERVDTVVSALRGFKAGGLSLGGIIHRRHTWLYKGLDTDRHTPRLMSHRATGYTLQDPSEIEAFILFWKSLQHPGFSQRKFLNIAVQRFGFASERQRDEDRIIDFLIAAEALFLNDIRNESYRGELTYRLSLRAGFFLGSNADDRKEISEHMRKAYAIRSAIVHGSSSLPLPKKEDGRELSLQVFVRTTEAYIRSALHKSIGLATKSATPRELVDWDALVFGVTNT